MIYIMKSEMDKFARLTLKGYSFNEKKERFSLRGKSRIKDWTIPQTAFETKRKRGDFYNYLLQDYALSKKALDMLKVYFPVHTEFLGMKNEEREIIAVNILEKIDCLDYNKSDLDAFNPVFWFQETKIKGKHIFKVSGHKLESIFVTSKIKQIVEEKGLKGFIFYPVYNGKDVIEYNVWSDREYED